MILSFTHSTGKRLLFIPFILLYLIILNSCAVNPATGQYEFMMVSEEQEFEIGQKVDKQVREEMGVYLELPRLRSLVKETGETLGRKSDRQGVIYRVEIVDRPDYNAFAVPGGFVYVNRGLLEKMNSLRNSRPPRRHWPSAWPSRSSSRPSHLVGGRRRPSLDCRCSRYRRRAPRPPRCRR